MRYREEQTIPGYSSATVWGWAPAPTYKEAIEAALSVPEIRESVTRNNALLMDLLENQGRVL